MTPKKFASWLAATAIPPLILFAIAVAVWHACVVGFRLKPYVFPSPWAVGQALVNDRSLLTSAVVYTGSAALCGFFASLLVGILIAFLFAQSRIIRAAGFPYFIFLQTVPIVAIAPLIVRWCGNGFQSVVLVAFILSLFPILSNGTQGLLEIDPNLMDLFRLNNASRWQILTKLRFPSAIPGILAGARTSSGLAVVGAIVGEFVGANAGLGYLLLRGTSFLDMPLIFACLVALSVVGIFFSYIVDAVEVLLMPWQRKDS